jgi:hypothetical protein
MKKLIPFLFLFCFLSCTDERTPDKYIIKLNYDDCNCPPDTITVYGRKLQTDYNDLLIDNIRVGINLRSHQVLSKEKQ